MGRSEWPEMWVRAGHWVAWVVWRVLVAAVLMGLASSTRCEDNKQGH